MIKVDKGLTKIQGDIASITAEGIVMLRAMHSLVFERFGKKFGDVIYKQMLELAEFENVKTNENSNAED
jgi:hypothetical protein